MNILVILRAVKDPAGLAVNRKAQKVFVNREQYIFNPSDRNALEAALRLTEQRVGTVTVVAFGGPPAEQVLRDARAMGAARALWVRDPALAGADAYVLTNVLCHLLDHVHGAELVLCGEESLDADLAQIGPRLAYCLDRPFLGGAHALTLTGNAIKAVVARGPGFHQMEADLPVVIGVARDSNKPRYAPGAGLMKVYGDAAAVETLSAADLGLGEAEMTPLTEARGESFPPERELGKRLEGDVAAQAAQLAALIRTA